MKNNILEYIILYVMLACVALALATLARISAASMGFDSFTTFMIFIVTLGIQVIVYLSIHVVLQSLMLPWIEKLLMKIPYFKNKARAKHSEIPDSNPQKEPPLYLDNIRNEQQQNKTKEQEEKLDIALDYTRKSFALYLSDAHLEVLCQNIQIYVGQLSAKELAPVKVKELTAIDLRHFGWNCWNFFKPRNQMDIAHFLKNVFPDVFKEVEVETIKRHLKDDELKGAIKIREHISPESSMQIY